MMKGVYTEVVKDPFKEWDRVGTFCALLVDLGKQKLTLDPHRKLYPSSKSEKISRSTNSTGSKIIYSFLHDRKTLIFIICITLLSGHN